VTHPRSIRPADKAYGMKVPGDLRLDDEGRIFCLTCHNAHGPFLSPTRAYAGQQPANPGAPAGTKPAYRTYYARRSDPERGFVALCEGCHGKQ
jgi:cytochrome c peroxidase